MTVDLKSDPSTSLSCCGCRGQPRCGPLPLQQKCALCRSSPYPMPPTSLGPRGCCRTNHFSQPDSQSASHPVSQPAGQSWNSRQPVKVVPIDGEHWILPGYLCICLDCNNIISQRLQEGLGLRLKGLGSEV